MPTNAQLAILALLAKEWNTAGPPGIIDISDVVAALPLPPSETMAVLKELYTMGLIDMNKFKTSVFLTPEGYESVSDQ